VCPAPGTLGLDLDTIGLCSVPSPWKVESGTSENKMRLGSVVCQASGKLGLALIRSRRDWTW